jgi:hypothetical protein
MVIAALATPEKTLLRSTAVPSNLMFRLLGPLDVKLWEVEENRIFEPPKATVNSEG